jgi:arsenate reductase (thioredoxin)
MKKVLFLCTGNSCRSIMAEALLNHFGAHRFIAFSAGSFPTGSVHPLSLKTLSARRIGTAGYRSKSWDEFTGQPIDIVITVCDAAAGESCPIFPGKPLKAHWGVPDPAKFHGTEADTLAEFSRVCDTLEKRIKALSNLPIDKMDSQELQQKLYTLSELA